MAAHHESSVASGILIDCCDVKRRRINPHEAEKVLGRSDCFSGHLPSFSDLVFTPLSAAIDAWECTKPINTRQHSSKINILASVVKWGILKETKGINTSIL